MKFCQSECLHIWGTGVGLFLMCQNFLLNLLIWKSTKVRVKRPGASGFHAGQDLSVRATKRHSLVPLKWGHARQVGERTTVTCLKRNLFSGPRFENQMNIGCGPEVITPSKLINTWILFGPDEPQIMKVQMVRGVDDRDQEQGVLGCAFMSAGSAWPLAPSWPQI